MRSANVKNHFKEQKRKTDLSKCYGPANAELFFSVMKESKTNFIAIIYL